VGKLLSVDLFAVVDSVQTSQTNGQAGRTATGLVVFDAKTGVRLWDATLSGAGVEKIAESVADGVLTAQRKQTVVGLPTICLMSVRNADLPRSLDTFCDSIGLLLERRLTASPGCVVLERGRLDQINKERELPGNAGQQQLLASLVMLELECNRGPDGKGMSASARLTDNNGKLLNNFSVTNQNANADELAVGLFQIISEVMKFTPGSTTEDGVRESDRFRQEAVFFLSQGDSRHGLQDLEAAFALQPDDEGLRKQLAGTLISYTNASNSTLDSLTRAESLLKADDDRLRRKLASALVGCAKASTNLLDALRIADKGMDLFLECARKAQDAIKPGSPARAYYFTADFDEWDKYMRNFNGNTFQDLNYLSPAEIEEARQLLHSIYEKYRSFRLDISLPVLAQAILQHPDDDLFEKHGYAMLAGTWSTENISALYRDEWSKDWLAMLKGYLDLLEQAPFEDHPGWLPRVRFNLNSVVLWPSTWREVNPSEREEAWRLMATNRYPLVRAFGKLDQMNEAKASKPKDGLSWAVAGEPYRLYLQDCLTSPAQGTNLFARRQFYEAAATTTDNYLGDPETIKFCDFMLQQNDLHPDILNRATSYLLSQTNTETLTQAIKFYDRAVALLKQPDLRYFGQADTNQYLQDLLSRRADAQKKRDGISEFPTLWREVHQIVDLTGAKKGITQLFRPVVQGDFVYAAGYSTDEANGRPSLHLLRISLKGEDVESSGKITVQGVAEPTPRMILQRKLNPLGVIAGQGVELNAACVDEKNYYLGTSQGVFIFPKTGGKVEVLDQNTVLPSDEVTALDCLDGKLYIGLGESGYLVSFDMKSHQCETLCSARRREQLSPFDNGSPLSIPILMADETNHRIVFLTDQGGGGGRLESILQPAKESNSDVFPMICAKARSGLWSYTPSSHEFKGILPRWPNANYYDIDWVGRVSETQIAFAGNASRGMALFDFTTDEHTLLAGSCVGIGLWFGVEETLQKHGMIVNPAFHSPPLMGSRVIHIDTASFVHDGWIWSAGRGRAENSFSRISMDTGGKQDLPPLRADDKEFSPNECFRLIGSDQALIGDQRGLWLVTFADEDTKTKGAKP
jgi:hypothetical protein